jgi:hypothetical protein
MQEQRRKPVPAVIYFYIINAEGVDGKSSAKKEKLT